MSASASAVDVPDAVAPIGPDERDRLFASLTLPLALAVSGGPDSMASMHLIAEWLGNRPGSVPLPDGVAPVVVVTVDHGLRPEAAAEARFVAEEAARLGLPHRTLVWKGAKPQSAVQELAREARYELIADAIAGEGLARPRIVVLAHHQDDQAETFLMRLARGSGVEGLAAMGARESRIHLRFEHPVVETEVEFCRPLLTLPKARLAATLAGRGCAIEDPSNLDGRFERVRWRLAAMQLADLGLINARVATSARRLRRARDALALAAQRTARGAVVLHEMGYAEVDPAALIAAGEDIAVRVLQSVVNALGGQEEPVRLSVLEAFVERLTTTGGAPPAGTLGGCILEPGPGGSLQIFRELGREGLSRVVLQPGQGVFWDRRFYISVSAAAAAPVEVGPLAQVRFAAVKRPSTVPARAMATLPAIRGGSRLLYVPHLAFAEPGSAPYSAEDLAVRLADRHRRFIFG